LIGSGTVCWPQRGRVGLGDAQDAVVRHEVLHAPQHLLRQHVPRAAQVVEHQRLFLLRGELRIWMAMPLISCPGVPRMASGTVTFFTAIMLRSMSRSTPVGIWFGSIFLGSLEPLPYSSTRPVSAPFSSRSSVSMLVRRVLFDRPPAVGGRVHDVRRAREALVEHLLGADRVVHHAGGHAAPEVGEVRHDREPRIRAHLVVQHDIARGDEPVDALHHPLRADPLAAHQVLREHVFRERVREHHVAGVEVHQHLAHLVLGVLAVDHAHALDEPLGVERVELGAGEAVPEVIAPGVLVGIAWRRLVQVERLDLGARILRRTAAPLVVGEPAAHCDVVPALVRVVGARIRVRHHVHRIFVADHDVARDVAVEVHADVEVPALLDEAVAVDLRFDPVQLVLVRDLHRDLLEDRGLRVVGGPPRGRKPMSMRLWIW
jgi:hypothetical protein